MKAIDGKPVRIEKASSQDVIYPSWDAFVKAKLDQANERLSRMDQDALRQLINPKKQTASD